MFLQQLSTTNLPISTESAFQCMKHLFCLVSQAERHPVGFCSILSTNKVISPIPWSPVFNFIFEFIPLPDMYAFSNEKFCKTINKNVWP